MKPIRIHKGDSTVFANVSRFLTFNIDTELDLIGYTAKFILCSVIKTITDIKSRKFDVILTSEETQKLREGLHYGSIVFTDNKGNTKTVINTIPFEITTAVVENEYQEIDLTIPQSSGVDIKLKVGVSKVTSVNGMIGDVNLTIPSIEGLATEQQLRQGLNTKQDKGDYALKSEIPDISGLATKDEIPDTSNLATKDEIPDTSNLATKDEIPSLEGYVKDTDYATSSKAGVVSPDTSFGTAVNSSGKIYLVRASDTTITNKKSMYTPLTPSNLDLAVKTGVTTNTIELSEDEKANAKNWLGYATPTDIMQAIASIPQFNMSIVNELPTTGEKMTLYLVPKEGTEGDVYDEYIWLEQTSSFEHLGTTAVDLTEYVKKTDYATTNTYGVVKVNTTGAYGIGMNDSAGLYLASATEQQVTAKTNSNKAITPLILDHAVKTGVTTNIIELTDDEKTSARTWLGAVGDTDYATTDKAGVIKTTTSYGLAVSSTTGILYGSTKSLALYNSANDVCVVCKGTLENVKDDYIKRGLTENTIELTDEEKTSARTWLGAVGSTYYAEGDSAGLVKVSATYGTFSTNGFLRCLPKDLSAYGSLNTYAFISKGTLDNVLTQYSKTVLTTEADYNALATKDANTLYLIEE